MPSLPLERVEIFARGIPHPEDVAFDREGWLYTGSAFPNYTDAGPIYRVSPDGQRVERFADTGGRVLGLAFDRDGVLYACDVQQHAVFRITPDGSVQLFADRAGSWRLQKPNYLLFDAAGSLYVSDSGTATAGERTAAVVRFTPSGEGHLFLDGLIFANGLALEPGGAALYIVETRDNRVLRVPIAPDGTAGEPSVFVDGLENGPDGLAFDRAGNLYVTVTRPSRIVRITPNGEQETLLYDPADERIQAPSNVALGGHEQRELYIANLFGSHIARVRLDLD